MSTKKGSSLVALFLKARRSFGKLNSREKILMLLFVFGLALIWASTLVSRQKALFDAIGGVHSEAEAQNNWLSVEEQVDLNHAELMAQIDLGNLPTRDEVSGRVDALVRQYFSKFELGQARTEAGVDLLFHQIPLTVQGASYSHLKQFTTELKARLPFISIERISIRPQSKNDDLLDASYLLKSIEYTK